MHGDDPASALFRSERPGLALRQPQGYVVRVSMTLRGNSDLLLVYYFFLRPADAGFWQKSIEHCWVQCV